MLFIFVGKDLEKRKKAFDLEKERFSDYQKIYFENNEFNTSILEEYAESQSLFGVKSFLVFDGVLENQEYRAFVFDKIKELENSENIFFFIENSLKKSDLKLVEKKVKNIQFFDLPAKKEGKFNIFNITDAFGAKDKKNTWVLIQKALLAGVSYMEIANILIWQIKNMLLVKGKKGSEEDIKKTGLNPFVFKKSLSASRNWEEETLKKALQDIVFLYHDDRRGESLATDLELFVLKTL